MAVAFIDTYRPPKILFEGHAQTIYPGIFRKIKNPVAQFRKRINTPDHDFLDVDLVIKGSKQLVIICHGLEGNSQRPYVQGVTKICATHHMDVIAWNYRGCSGQINKTARYYHGGATDDLVTVIQWAVEQHDHEDIFLVGFSLGGNLILKYLGEQNTTKFRQIKKALAFSVPLDIRAASLHSKKPHNFLYARSFLNSLMQKMTEKSKIMPQAIKLENLRKVKSIYDFDHFFTGPLHGYKGAEDYYQNCSAINYIRDIQIETYIVSAQNDPLLPFQCLDPKPFKSIKNVTLLITKEGGHCGYPTMDESGYYWSEYFAMDYLK